MISLGRHCEALQELQNLVTLAPNEFALYLAAGQAFKQTGSTSLAAKYFVMASDLAPKTSNVCKEQLEKLYADQNE